MPPKSTGKRNDVTFADRYAIHATTSKPHRAYPGRPAMLSRLLAVAGLRVLDADLKHGERPTPGPVFVCTQAKARKRTSHG